MTDEDSADKEHEATPQRLEEARRRGEVPRSPDLAVAVSYGALVLLSAAAGAPLVMQAGAVLTGFLSSPDRLAAQVFAGSAASALGPPVAGLAMALGPFLAVPFLAVLGAFAVQRAIAPAPEKLLPRLNRISPLAGLSNRFGRRGLVEFAKNTAKLVVVAAILGLFLAAEMRHAPALAGLGPGPSLARFGQVLLQFLAICALVMLAFGGLDWLWQRAEHLRKNRMSRKELTDEIKAGEGDPQVKAQRRQKAMAIAANRMLADVAGADVVIVNPTHYAVALRWDRGARRAPVCVAKGVDEIAARIRERAAEAGVPLHRDPPAARSLHAAVALGEEIRPEHYRAVAAAIRFADAMRARARAGAGARR
ncbi:MAG TPA: flagellar type III secretion system protein FlhB [Paracoccaceae bacterium]|nr:flagellar type III secretion system protein FlhB [Paracoccaceae bacterium]